MRLEGFVRGFVVLGSYELAEVEYGLYNGSTRFHGFRKGSRRVLKGLSGGLRSFFEHLL